MFFMTCNHFANMLMQSNCCMLPPGLTQLSWLLTGAVSKEQGHSMNQEIVAPVAFFPFHVLLVTDI